jgi:hypothetical protein
MFSPEADLFFQQPSTPPSIPGTFGILYLLRRDALQCLGIDPNTGAENGSPALWPGTMTVLAGVDLLAKFLAGDDKPGGFGWRFQEFVSRFFQPIDQGDEVAIYQLRNALLHSFGLYSETKSEKFRFTVGCGGAKLVTRIDKERLYVDIATLHEKFEYSVVEYQCDLDGCSQLQRNFRNMFPKYGFTNIG